MGNENCLPGKTLAQKQEEMRLRNKSKPGPKLGSKRKPDVKA